MRLQRLEIGFVINDKGKTVDDTILNAPGSVVDSIADK